MENKKVSFLKKNFELIFGSILIISHSLIWFLPAYILGRKDINQYKFFKIFPEWFAYSGAGSFILVVGLVLVYVIFIK